MKIMQWLVLLVTASHTNTTKEKLIAQAKEHCSPVYRKEFNHCQTVMGSNFMHDCEKTAVFKKNICVRGYIKKSVKKYKESIRVKHHIKEH